MTLCLANFINAVTLFGLILEIQTNFDEILKFLIVHVCLWAILNWLLIRTAFTDPGIVPK